MQHFQNHILYLIHIRKISLVIHFKAKGPHSLQGPEYVPILFVW